MNEWFFFFSSRRRHTRYWRDWSSDVCSSDLEAGLLEGRTVLGLDLDQRAGDRQAQRAGLTADAATPEDADDVVLLGPLRSEERRVGKECRSRWSPYH